MGKSGENARKDSGPNRFDVILVSFYYNFTIILPDFTIILPDFTLILPQFYPNFATPPDLTPSFLGHIGALYASRHHYQH